MWSDQQGNIVYEFLLTSPAVFYMPCFTWMVLEVRGQCPFSCCFVGCCFQDLSDLARSILVHFPSSFFSVRFFSVHVVHPYSRIGTTVTWKKLCFILSDRCDFHMIDNLSKAVPVFTRRILIPFSVDETLLPMYVYLSTYFRELLFRVKLYPFLLKYMYSVLSVFTWRLMPPAACSRLRSRDSAWVGVFAKSAISSA